MVYLPRPVELNGKRHKVDDDNQYVEHMGWKFYTRFDRDVVFSSSTSVSRMSESFMSYHFKVGRIDWSLRCKS